MSLSRKVAAVVAVCLTLPGVVLTLAGMAFAFGQDREIAEPPAQFSAVRQQVELNEKLDAIILELAKADESLATAAVESGILTAAELNEAIAIDPTVTAAASALAAPAPAPAAPAAP